nr:patatin-like phospholipase [Oceanusvirus sp.]
MYVNLSIAGGAHLCMSFLGFLRCARPPLANVVNVSAASAGALIATVFVLDIPDDTVIRIVNRHMKNGMLEDPDLAMLLDEFGVVDSRDSVGALAADLVQAGIDRWKTIKKGWWDEEKTSARTFTMLDLSKMTGKNVAIMVADASRGFCQKFITADNYPDLPLVTALCASCAIPIVLTPVQFPGDDVGLYVDGCASPKNAPFEYFDQLGPCVEGVVDTLCVEVNVFSDGKDSYNPEAVRPTSLIEYGKALVGLLGARISTTTVHPRCRVHTVPRWTEDRVSPMVFGMSPADVADAYRCGMRSGRDFIESLAKDTSDAAP